MNKACLEFWKEEFKPIDYNSYGKYRFVKNTMLIVSLLVLDFISVYIGLYFLASLISWFVIVLFDIGFQAMEDDFEFKNILHKIKHGYYSLI